MPTTVMYVDTYFNVLEFNVGPRDYCEVQTNTLLEMFWLAAQNTQGQHGWFTHSTGTVSNKL
jgi:hypothetical protein